MADEFPLEIKEQAFERAKGRCECKRGSHKNHPYEPCRKPLVWENPGREGEGCWEAHHINPDNGEVLPNCEILCWPCHKQTESFGVVLATLKEQIERIKKLLGRKD